MASSTVEITPGVKVYKVSHGLMMMKQDGRIIPDEECFAAIKAGIELCPPGVKMVLNSADFYGPGLGVANLELLSRFFEQYPEYASRAFLSVKSAAVKDGKFNMDSSMDNLRLCLDNCHAALRSKKKIDLFQCARVDPKIPIEETMKNLLVLHDEGKFDFIGMSECRAETIRRAAKVAPISGVEIEISPMSYEDETKKVIATCAELGIPIFGYSPVARGILTSAPLKPEDLPKEDWRNHMTRFQPEVYEHNMKIVEVIKKAAERHNATPAQLSIAWVSVLGPHVIPLPGSSKATRTVENTKAGEIHLSQAEVEEIRDAVEAIGVRGDRYNKQQGVFLWG